MSGARVGYGRVLFRLPYELPAERPYLNIQSWPTGSRALEPDPCKGPLSWSGLQMSWPSESGHNGVAGANPLADAQPEVSLTRYLFWRMNSRAAMTPVRRSGAASGTCWWTPKGW